MSNPHSNDTHDDAGNLAADLIRTKLQGIYADEPAAEEELAEAQHERHRSKHQQYMLELSQSGRLLADIQTAWHNYYLKLPDNEKHEVWQEFYDEYNKRDMPKKASHATVSHEQHAQATPPPATSHSDPISHNTAKKRRKHRRHDTRTKGEVKQQLLGKVDQRATAKRGGHLKSLAFGAASGLIVVVILLFSFFNERFLAPFVTPSKTVSNNSIIIDQNATTAGSEPLIIIPKINVEIPVVYDEPSIDENAVHSALDRGVVHYATTPNPGELGNGAIFGHSANNIFNKGKYKFAFVLLKRLENGDTFIIQKDGKRYVYRVFDKKIVRPDNVSVLNYNYGKPATFSLITCDPPGTSLNRLIVTGEQITPDPGTNVASSAKASQASPKVLPSNSETLWHRLVTWLSS